MLNTLIRARSAAVAATSTTTVECPSSDESLIARIANDDRFAMEVLFARHRTRVYRWLLQFADEALAEDLLSDVFLDVWRQAGRFAFRSSVATWLLSIARFKALSAHRRRTDAELDEKIDIRRTCCGGQPAAPIESSEVRSRQTFPPCSRPSTIGRQSQDRQGKRAADYGLSRLNRWLDVCGDRTRGGADRCAGAIHRGGAGRSFERIRLGCWACSQGFNPIKFIGNSLVISCDYRLQCALFVGRLRCPI
jgi:RNA polymerase sigma factor (sigma-70 family)